MEFEAGGATATAAGRTRPHGEGNLLVGVGQSLGANILDLHPPYKSFGVIASPSEPDRIAGHGVDAPDGETIEGAFWSRHLIRPFEQLVSPNLSALLLHRPQRADRHHAGHEPNK